MPLHGSPSALLALATLSLIWGYNWVVMKQALAYSGPLDFAALRCSLGALALFLVMAALRRSFRPPPWEAVLWLGLFQTTGNMGLTMLALVHGAAGKTSVLIYTMPFWVLLFGWPFLHERMHRGQWVAVALALAGLVLIIRPWDFAGTLVSSLLGLASGMAWAGGTIAAKRLRRKYEFDLLSLTAWQMAAGSLPLIALALAMPQREIEWTPAFVAALAYNAVPATAIAWLLWLFLLQRLPAAIAGLNMLAAPVVGVAGAWLQLGERPLPVEIAGMLLIAFALSLLSWAGIRQARVSDGSG